jgi:hypothetical protein
VRGGRGRKEEGSAEAGGEELAGDGKRKAPPGGEELARDGR